MFVRGARKRSSGRRAIRIRSFDPQITNLQSDFSKLEACRQNRGLFGLTQLFERTTSSDPIYCKGLSNQTPHLEMPSTRSP
jgi:hypothetical protein